MNEEITENSIEKVVVSLRKMISDDPKSSIKIFINSIGGMLYESLLISNIIKNSKTPIHTIALSYAFSGAFLIFIAGHKRYCFETTHLLAHTVQIEKQRSETFLTQKVEQKALENGINMMIDLCTKKSIKSRKYWEGIFLRDDKDTYYTASQAKEYGITDEILINLNNI